MFKLALCQIKGSFDKKESMATVTHYVETAAENGAQVISLPEMWNCPYSNDYFREYAEAEDGPTVKFLSDLAAEHGHISHWRIDPGTGWRQGVQHIVFF